MRISDWSSDVCSSDLNVALDGHADGEGAAAACRRRAAEESARPLCRCDRLESRIGNPRRSGRSPGDRKSVVQGKSVSVRVDLGGRRTMKKTNQPRTY